MRIACIAWGSLLWKTGPLKLASDWMPGGPMVGLEFLRDSDDSEELAIVLADDAPPMPTWWAVLDTDSVDTAREMLRQREKITPVHPEWVGSIPGEPTVKGYAQVAEWLSGRELDAVVWTALPAKFAKTGGRAPTADEALAFLAGLHGEERQKAEQYVRQVPAAIRTPYRARFEQELGWTPQPLPDRAP